MAEKIERNNVIRIYGGAVSSSEIVKVGMCYVQKVVWTGATTAAHKAILTDKDGYRWAEFTADAPGTSGELMYGLDFPAREGLPVDGINIIDLDSGSVYIYLNPVG